MMDPRLSEVTAVRDIGGIAYTSTKWPATTALHLYARCVAVLGDAGLRVLVQAARGEEGFSGDFMRKVLELLGTHEGARGLLHIGRGLAEDRNLPHDLTTNLKASRVLPGGKPGEVQRGFDAHFSGEYLHLLEVLGFVLAHNLLGFTLGGGLLSGSRTPSETTQGDPSTSQTPSEE